MKTVLVFGASGLVGTAAASSFSRAGWRVITCSRRRATLLTQENHKHLQLDITDRARCLEVLTGLDEDVSHVVYAAVQELPGLIPGWSDPDQIALNGEMLENVIEPLRLSNSLEHVSLLQGTKAYGGSIAPIRVPARESQDRVEHPNFYWLHEDYLKKISDQCGFSYTVFRPQLIVGPNHGVVMNLPPIVGVYAAMRKKEGLPLSFPGGADWVWEAVDVRLVGVACLWAAEAENAKGETFNLTNGEVFSWRDMWPAIAETLCIEMGPEEPLSLADYLPERASMWTEIAIEHGLSEHSLESILGESHHYADLCFAYGSLSPPPPTFVSTIKIKQAGFTETYDSEASFCYWLRDLQKRKVIPY